MGENSIGQTMPDHWQKLTKVNEVALSKLFQDAKVEVILNSNQTFVYFDLEESVVVSPKNTKRVCGMVKSYAKAGFAEIVKVNLGTSYMDAPFLLFNGTKLKDTKNPKSTLAYRYRHWRDLSIGRSGHISFQRKH